VTGQGPSALITILQNLVQSVGALSEASQFVEVMGYTFVGDTDYKILPTDRVINSNATSTATRTWMFPALTTVKPGQRLTLILAPSTFPFKLVTTGTDQLWSTLSGPVPAMYTNGGTIIWDFIADVGAKLWLNYARDPIAYSTPGGRLSAAPSTPVPSTSVTNATTVYYTPYTGTWAPIFQGVDMQMVNLLGSDLSQPLSDATKSPAAAVANTVYDMFLWNDAGTFRCTRGPAWGSANARAMALQKLAGGSGIWVNSTDITNGPKALFGTYVGTIWVDAGGFLQWIYGGASSGGLAPEFLIWNMYNRVDVAGFTTDSGASYTYASTTFRAPRASGANVAYLVCGQIEDGLFASYEADVSIPSGGTNRADIGVAINSTTPAKRATITNQSTTAALAASGHVSMSTMVGLGQNTVFALEAAGVGTITFDNLSESRLNIKWRA
jgi:hypothetical protein